MEALDLAGSFLVNSANPDGGWGYTVGGDSAVEATSAVLLALNRYGLSEDVAKSASDWLASSQNHDGGWGLNSEDDESGWQTAWAMVALLDVSAADENVGKGIAWLVDTQSIDFDSSQDLAATTEFMGIDLSIRGWPWLPGDAGWVEPTALAMVALNRTEPTTSVETRLADGVRYLVDRRCEQGGWNFGNPEMFGAQLPPRAHATAWAIMALNRMAPDAIIADDIVALRGDMKMDGGTVALAWGLMALNELGEEDIGSVERLRALQANDGSWNQNPYQTATALVALHNPHIGLFG